MTDPLLIRFGRDFVAGETLFREGEPGDRMYVIQSGLVQIFKRVGTEQRSLGTFGRGEFLGELAILNGKPRTATALVLEDAKCLVIGAATLEQMIATSTEIAVRLVKKLARRLDSADEMIQMLLNPDPQARVLLALKRQAEIFGEERVGGGIRLRVSAADVAREVGVDEAQVRDVLVRLLRMRVAIEDDGGIAITDLSRLLEFMEFLEMPRKFEA